MPDDFFRDEFPEEEIPDDGWGDDGDGGGGPGSGGGGGPGGGGGGGGGGGWGGGGGGGTWGEDDDEPPTEDEDDPEFLPYLKLSQSKGLLISKTPHLLRDGPRTCERAPATLVFTLGDDDDEHHACVLCKLSGTDRPFSAVNPKEGDGYQRKGLAVICDWPWAVPGRFKLQVRWQSGHYDHREINSMRFEIYGVKLDWRSVPMSKKYVDVATITISEKYEVFVNGVKGSVAGNAV